MCVLAALALYYLVETGLLSYWRRVLEYYYERWASKEAAVARPPGEPQGRRPVPEENVAVAVPEQRPEAGPRTMLAWLLAGMPTPTAKGIVMDVVAVLLAFVLSIVPRCVVGGTRVDYV